MVSAPRAGTGGKMEVLDSANTILDSRPFWEEIDSLRVLGDTRGGTLI